MSAANEIEKLAKLRDAGDLTQAEFEVEKAKILAIYDVPSRVTPGQTAPGPAKAATSKGCLIAAVAVPLVLIGGCFALINSGDGSPASEDTNKAAVIVKCRDSVKQQLKAPKSADFSDETATSTGVAHQYTVTGSVDAENSYGAALRTRWVCTGSATNGYKTAVASATLLE